MNNNSQKPEIQTIQDFSPIKANSLQNIDFELHELSKKYPLENPEEIREFLKNNEKILPFINEITPLINEYFPDYDKLIEFSEDPEFSELDYLLIYIKTKNYKQDNETLKKFKDEPLYLSKYSKKINGLLCVELW